VPVPAPASAAAFSVLAFAAGALLFAVAAVVFEPVAGARAVVLRTTVVPVVPVDALLLPLTVRVSAFAPIAFVTAAALPLVALVGAAATAAFMTVTTLTGDAFTIAGFRGDAGRDVNPLAGTPNGGRTGD